MGQRGGRKRKVQVTLAERAVAADRLTPERAKMLKDALEEREVVDPDDGGKRMALTVSDAPLDRLAKGKHITQSMWEAGDRLRRHHLQSGLEQMRAVDWTRPYVDGGIHKPEPEFREAHLRQYNRAVAAVRPWQFNVLRDIVLDERPVDDCGAVRTMYATQRDRTTAGMTELRNALRALAEHFGLPVDWKSGLDA
jgi:hypothetical protein